MPRSKFLALLLTAYLCGSCDSNRVYDEYQSLPNSWNKDSAVTFKVEAPDTTNTYNLFVNLRNNNDYKYNNLYLIVEMNYPQGKVVADTLLYRMAASDGSFLGEGFTDVQAPKLWYKGYEEPFVFQESGTYAIAIKQAMREQGAVNGIAELEGVLDVGFRIEKPQTN